jgi:selenide,water dikinase
VLPGALECLNDLNIKSTLHDANKAACLEMTTLAHRKMPLGFDPQTSGGLLAAVPAAKVERVLAELHDKGYEQAADIGRISSVGQTHLFFE